MAAGTLSPAELMADIKEGLYVTELIGMGVNGVTGDYSRGAAGFMIRDGAIAEPVAEITIAGHLLEMFAHLTPGERSSLQARYRRPHFADRRHDAGGSLTGLPISRLPSRNSEPMRRTSFVLAAFAALALSLAPGLADARAGGGGSMGSRGGRTWSAPPSTSTAPSSQPFQRSMTPNTPSSPGYAAPGYGAPGYAAPRSALHLGPARRAGRRRASAGCCWATGSSADERGFGFLGFLLQIFLIVMVVRWLIRRFRGARPASPAPAASSPRPAAGPRPMPMGRRRRRRARSRGRRSPSARRITRRSSRSCRRSRRPGAAQDLNALRALATPEMVSYFAEQLADQSSRGVRNTVTDVRLEQGRPGRSLGRERPRIRHRGDALLDDRRHPRRLRPHRRRQPERARHRDRALDLYAPPGGRWILSAIQQAR